MNRIHMRKEKIAQYKAVIFDLDGTLYYQNPFRLRMACWLLGYLVRHPSSLKDMLIIKKYRKVRENWEKYDTAPETGNMQELDGRQYAYVAEKMKVTSERVRKTVTFFMLEAPLKLLPGYRDNVLADMIKELRNHKITVIIYSDYPVQDKLKALRIKADICYTSSDRQIGCMKPDPKGIGVILRERNLSNTEALMIGDRYEKDGLAAQGNDMDYIIVSKKKKERELLRDLLA
ncbi:MAG: HAD family hydrolase [Lachnospiraceae bacterium]|nr:HAD family hydrolase [Lachnospiraceae bacterium]